MPSKELGCGRRQRTLHLSLKILQRKTKHVLHRDRVWHSFLYSCQNPLNRLEPMMLYDIENADKGSRILVFPSDAAARDVSVPLLSRRDVREPWNPTRSQWADADLAGRGAQVVTEYAKVEGQDEGTSGGKAAVGSTRAANTRFLRTPSRMGSVLNRPNSGPVSPTAGSRSLAPDGMSLAFCHPDPLGPGIPCRRSSRGASA